MRRLERRELLRGLALLLDPDMLLANGATYTGGSRGRARGPHFLVCLAPGTPSSCWIATSSKPAQGRIQLKRKFGKGGWIELPTYADLWQTWDIPFDALSATALIFDRSHRGQRNYANLDCLESSLAAFEAA